MEKSQFLSSLEELIEAEPGSLSESVVLSDTPGWDSMAIMGFIAFVDEELGTNPNPSAIKACRTVGDLMKLVGI